ncbi:MAG: diguanylate cyclase [Actinobacteria bacterium]|nr:diguanylate cyclase [Actinomycetota bacterium]
MTERGTDIGFDDARDRPGGDTTHLRRILDAAGVPTATLDGEGQVISLNPAFARLCGRGPSEVVGLHLLSLCPGRDQAEMLSKLVRIVGAVSEVEREELRVTGADGRVRTLSITLCGVAGADGRVDHVVAIGSDLTQQRRDRRRLREQSLDRASDLLTDSATGTPNERALGILVGSASRRSAVHSTPFAVLRCELTNLEALCGSHGQDAVDRAATAVVERLRQRLRSEDTVTRSAHDVLTVIAEDLGDVQDAAGVAYRLLASVVEPVTLDDGTALEVAMVVGIAVGDASTEPARLLAEAAAATVEARSEGVGGFRILDARTPTGV